MRLPNAGVGALVQNFLDVREAEPLQYKSIMLSYLLPSVAHVFISLHAVTEWATGVDLVSR